MREGQTPIYSEDYANSRQTLLSYVLVRTPKIYGEGRFMRSVGL